MSTKSFIQILILILIALIIGAIYLKYFSFDKNIVEEINTTETDKSFEIAELEKKISDLELENNKLNNKIDNSKKITDVTVLKDLDSGNSEVVSKNIEKSKKEINKKRAEVKKKR